MPVDRAALVARLSDPERLHTIAAILHRFDTGLDPLPDDEAQVIELLRARAQLDATAPSPDPLAPSLASLDARWAPYRHVAWVLDDEAWAACFAEPPSPERWWGARAGGPSEQEVWDVLCGLPGRTQP